MLAALGALTLVVAAGACNDDNNDNDGELSPIQRAKARAEALGRDLDNPFWIPPPLASPKRPNDPAGPAQRDTKRTRHAAVEENGPRRGPRNAEHPAPRKTEKRAPRNPKGPAPRNSKKSAKETAKDIDDAEQAAGMEEAAALALEEAPARRQPKKRSFIWEYVTRTSKAEVRCDVREKTGNMCGSELCMESSP